MSNELHELMIFGPTPPWPGYFRQAAERAIAEERRWNQLLRIKAMITLADVLEVCEIQEAA